jgi:hypothetical protein
MVRTCRTRDNAAGDRIGPELKIRVCDALLFYRVQDRVLVAIERGAERRGSFCARCQVEGQSSGWS